MTREELMGLLTRIDGLEKRLATIENERTAEQKAARERKLREEKAKRATAFERVWPGVKWIE